MQIIGNIIQQLQQRGNQIITEFRKKRGNISLLLFLNPIERDSVDFVFDLINNAQFKTERATYANPNNLDVIVDSFGGDADAAYHISKLLESNFSGEISYIIPRYAKSATTLLICGGNKIVMGETSELGPLDPQIAQQEGGFISAKSVQSTLELIEEHLEKKDKVGLQLATILASRLNPLTLGQYESTMKIAQEYQKELLKLRMFPTDEKRVGEIVKKFATGYSHHSRVIGCTEAKEIFGEGLTILKTDSHEWNLIWEFYETNKNIAYLLGVLKLLDQNKIK
jgi:ATP-dependent protease ClpP protease subunit